MNQLSSRAFITDGLSLECLYNTHTRTDAFSDTEAQRPLRLLLCPIHPVQLGTEGGSLASSTANIPTVVPARHFWKTLTGDSETKISKQRWGLQSGLLPPINLLRPWKI